MVRAVSRGRTGRRSKTMQNELERLLDTQATELGAERETAPLDVKAGLRRIDVTLKKMNEKAPLQAGKIPLSSLCTSACFSSISSVLVNTMGSGEGTNASEMSVETQVR